MGFRLCSKYPLTWGVWNKRVLQPSAGNSKDNRACQTQGALESQVILEADMVIIVNSTLYLSLLLCSKLSNPLVSPPPPPPTPLLFSGFMCMYTTLVFYSNQVHCYFLLRCRGCDWDRSMHRDKNQWANVSWLDGIKAPQWKEIKNIKSSNDWMTLTLDQQLVSRK